MTPAHTPRPSPATRMCMASSPWPTLSCTARRAPRRHGEAAPSGRAGLLKLTACCHPPASAPTQPPSHATPRRSDFYCAWLLWSAIGLWHGLCCFFVPLAALGRRGAVSRNGAHASVNGLGTAVMTAVVITVTLRVSEGHDCVTRGAAGCWVCVMRRCCPDLASPSPALGVSSAAACSGRDPHVPLDRRQPRAHLGHARPLAALPRTAYGAVWARGWPGTPVRPGAGAAGRARVLAVRRDWRARCCPAAGCGDHDVSAPVCAAPQPDPAGVRGVLWGGGQVV
jgi:hypothetical protein